MEELVKHLQRRLGGREERDASPRAHIDFRRVVASAANAVPRPNVPLHAPLQEGQDRAARIKARSMSSRQGRPAYL